jgi:hypothetical protein
VGARQYVQRWREIIADPTRADADPLLHAWRSVRLTADDGSMLGLSTEAMNNLVKTVPRHRLAFEYLMACHLLRNEQTEIISRLPMLRSLDYAELPRHYAEALLVYSLKTGKPVDAQGWTVDPNLQQQLGEIRSVVTRSGGDDRRAYEILAPQYGDTYMFYSMFSVCGLK